MAARGARAAAPIAGDRPEEFANFIELPTSPTGPRSFQLLGRLLSAASRRRL